MLCVIFLGGAGFILQKNKNKHSPKLLQVEDPLWIFKLNYVWTTKLCSSSRQRKFFVRQCELHKIAPSSLKNKKIMTTQLVGKLTHWYIKSYMKTCNSKSGRFLPQVFVSFHFFFFLKNTLPIPIQDRGKLLESYSQSIYWPGFMVSPAPYIDPKCKCTWRQGTQFNSEGKNARFQI